MSVLNQSGEEQVECPLCMEPLEVDDLNFFPCTCGYQICRFCWHRIRTDENGLCPACRKAYSENPADFTPLSKEQVAQLKAEKRQRDQQRKAKLSESRKHLASVRVVQRNLVFVVGLPVRLADPEILKRHEYFGKFGKIHKVVINQSTSYAGTQGPSASAYVTYMKSDDALRAIQSVNNITIDGRLIKSSLGTTKYCSHFMKNQPCPKPDCMYLHDFGDSEASFTKEQMHAGKHQEYEKKLHEALLNKMAAQNAQAQMESKQPSKSKESAVTNSSNSISNTSKDNWPQLNSEKTEKDKKSEKTDIGKEKSQKGKNKTKSGGDSKKVDKNGKCSDTNCSGQNSNSKSQLSQESKHNIEKTQSTVKNRDGRSECDGTESITKLPILDDNSSFFSQNSFQKIVPDQNGADDTITLLENPGNQPSNILNDSMPDINSTEDWEAAFGFSKQKNHLEELAKQRNNVKDTLETFGNSFNTLGQREQVYGKLDTFNHLENYSNSSYDISKIQESILDVLSNNKNNTHYNQNIPFSKTNLVEDRLQSQFGIGTHNKDLLNGLNGLNGVNGLDQQMSKFFTDFCKNGQKDLFNGLGQPNNLNLPNGYVHSIADRQSLLLLQQRQIEEQLMNLNLKQQSYSQQLLHNGLQNGRFLNGDVLAQHGQGFGPLHNQLLYQNSALQMNKQNARGEAELDFDPFHETQKALAELMETEQNLKMHSTVSGRSSAPTSQINGLVHNPGSASHLPPPPGFVQQNSHMNSFGSKILPYLNMGSSQQQPSQINSTTQSNWPGGYSQLHQHKGMGVCNDWKVLDPAIVSSSRHFPLANMQPIRDQYNSPQPIGSQQIQNGPIRTYDFPNSTYSNSFNQQIQQGYSNFSHSSSQPNINWFGSELNSQISSPPGFRTNNQATKQQEC